MQCGVVEAVLGQGHRLHCRGGAWAGGALGARSQASPSAQLRLWPCSSHHLPALSLQPRWQGRPAVSLLKGGGCEVRP